MFALSPDQVKTEWTKQQRRQQQQDDEEQRKQLLASEKRVQETDRVGGTGSPGSPAILRHTSRSSNCSSRGSTSQPDDHTPSIAGRDDACGGGERTLGDAAETVILSDGCSTTAEVPLQKNAVPASDDEVPADQEAPAAAADQEGAPGPTVGSCPGASCDVSHTSLGEPEDETGEATAKADEECDARVRGNEPLADTAGGGGVVGGAKEEPFPGLFFDELLDKIDSESSGDDGDSSMRTKGRHRSTNGGTGSLLDGSSGHVGDGDGTNIEPEKTAREKSSVLSWIISRMGLLEKVSPVCVSK